MKCNEGGSVTVRRVQQSDCDAVQRLIEPYVKKKILLARTIDELNDLLAGGFVAECNGEVVGFAALEVYSRKLAEIRSLVVSEPYQHRGIGRQLVKACVAEARRLQVMEVLAISSSEAFFRSCGFDYTLPDEKKAFFFSIRERP